MQVVCCCDFEECDVSNLIRRNQVLSTMAGTHTFPHVIDAVVKIQARSRGNLLRCDKHIFDHSVNIFLNSCKTFLIRNKFLKMKHAAINIQRIARGHNIRSGPFFRLFKLLMEEREEKIQLELQLLSRKK